MLLLFQLKSIMVVELIQVIKGNPRSGIHSKVKLAPPTLITTLGPKSRINQVTIGKLARHRIKTCVILVHIHHFQLLLPIIVMPSYKYSTNFYLDLFVRNTLLLGFNIYEFKFISKFLVKIKRLFN